MEKKNNSEAHVVDCNSRPFVPDGWKLERHIRNGVFIDFNPSKIKLYPQSGIVKLRKELANANVLDFFLRHSHIIPDEWKKDASGRSRHILFWGTIYICPIKDARYKKSYLVRYVRSLFFSSSHGKWGWAPIPLVNGWKGNGYVAILN